MNLIKCIKSLTTITFLAFGLLFFNCNHGVQATDLIKHVIKQNLPSSVYIQTDQGQGSGSILSYDGIIVTCFHVIEGMKTGVVKAKNEIELPINEVLAVDLAHDVALIKVNTKPLKVPLEIVTMGSVDSIGLGDTVITIGNPRGLQFSVSEGIISSFHDDKNEIQFTAPISPGSSGGGLFDSHGQLIGITSSSDKDIRSQNLNFATAINIVKVMLDNLAVASTQSGRPVNDKLTLPKQSDEKQKNTVNNTIDNQLLQDNLYAKSLEAALERYYAENKNSELARLKLASFYNKRQEYNKALALLEDKLFEFSGSFTDELNYTKAMSHFFLNQPEKALPLFESLSLSKRHQNPKNYLFMAHLYINRNDLTNTRLCLKKYNLYSEKKDAFYYHTLGELSTAYALRETGELGQNTYFEKAIGFYELASTENEQMLVSIYKKGLVQLATGNFNDARESLNQLRGKDVKLTEKLEYSLLKYSDSYNTALKKYNQEIRKEQLKNSLEVLVYGLILATSLGY